MWEIWVVIALLGGGGAGYLIRFFQEKAKLRKAGDEARKLIEEARAEGERYRKELELQAKEEISRRKEEQEKEFAEVRKDLRNQQRRLDRMEESLSDREELFRRKERALEQREAKLAQRGKELDERSQELERMVAQEKVKLLELSGLSEEEAREAVMRRVEEEVSEEVSAYLQKRQQSARDEAEKVARDVVLTAIGRLGVTFSSESTVYAVDIPNDEMKGRIIGREGRNIRAFEKETGVDVVVDDTPGVVVISSFDPVKREVARITLERLIQDGRIHPARIEEMVHKVQKEVDQRILETGKQVCYDFGFHNIHPRLVELLGRLRYRTSYGQNCLTHTYEACYLAGAMAAELGLDTHLAVRCALFHDIGKAVSHESEGAHPMVGADLARRCGEPPEVVNAIAAHHEDVPFETPYAVLTQVADAISASRPGARRDSVDRYIKRLEKLEEIASSHQGVKSCYAVQAGREVRVIVDAARVDDNKATLLAQNIAREIEESMDYLGEVRVTLIRETRVVDYAR